MHFLRFFIVLLQRKNKRFRYLLLSLCLFCIPVEAGADVLLGRVQAIQEAERQVVVELFSAERNEIPDSRLTIILPEAMVFKRPNGRFLPGCIQLGARIKVWGEFDSEDALFRAERIRGGGHLRSDPTGIRERLGMGCRIVIPLRSEGGPELDDGQKRGMGGRGNGGGHGGGGGGNGGGGGR